MKSSKVLTIEVLELDMSHIGSVSCNTCGTVESTVNKLADELNEIFRRTDTEIQVKNILISNLEEVEKHRFKASPTIRVGKMEIIPTEGDITGLGERYWMWKGESFSLPPAGLIIDTVLRAYSDHPIDAKSVTMEYQMPKVLRSYFTEKLEKKETNCCSG